LSETVTYDESITFPSYKKVVLKSANGPSSTIIRGNGGSPTVTALSFQEGTTLEGFTISHASGNKGRGIETDGNLNISNCIIAGNYAYGLWTWNDFYPGGGICTRDGSIIITESTISGNSAGLDAGGIYLHEDESNPEVVIIGGSSDAEKNTICGNYKIGEVLSLDQQIRDYSGSLYDAKTPTTSLFTVIN